MTNYLQLVLEDQSDSSLVFITKSLPFLSSFFLSYLVQPWQNIFFEIRDFYFDLIQNQALKKVLIQLKIVHLRFALSHLSWTLKLSPILSSSSPKAGS
jgi:hypothetical protein